MRFCYGFALCWLIAWPQLSGGEMAGSTQGTSSGYPMDVEIASNAVRVPTGAILLVRKDAEYCAIKFTKFWTGKTEEDQYASYESCYQGDKTGSFSNKNVKFKKGELSRPRLRGIGRLSFSFGKTDIQCGPIKLEWSGKGWIYFFNSNQDQGDHGIELAPTKWTEISEINVFDPRLKWYRYDSTRQDIRISVDRLWDDQTK
jgi:hypothetical protein